MEQLDDENTKSYIQNMLDQQANFINSVRVYRKKVLAHNGFGEETYKIPTGIEVFFESLNNMVIEIKKWHPSLSDCNGLNLDFSEKLSEAGVQDIFNKIK